ncbi:MAG: ABC transporter permease [Oscillospiraceae bacterium]|nr:ABC transporter permease [Oscillospiraceae bacterium]
MRKLSSKLYMYALYLFLYLPIIVLIVFSFNVSKSRSNWTGFTLDWYVKLFHNEAILTSLRNTVIVALAASIFATILGTTAALGINSMKKRSKTVFMNLTYIPVVSPEIIMGVSLMLLFQFFRTSFGFQFGFASLILSHISFDVPYVIYSVLPKLRSMNPSLVEAAQDLGCNQRQAFFKVVIPEIMPGIFTGFLMSVTYSIDDFVVSYFTSGTNVQTLSITIESMTRLKVSPEINALSAIIFLVICVILITKNILDNRKLRREQEQFRAAQRKESMV